MGVQQPRSNALIPCGVCCARLLWDVQAEVQRDVSKENCPSKSQAHVPESTLKRCGRVLVGDKLVTWLCKQRY